MSFKNISNFDELKASGLKYGDMVHLVIRDGGRYFSTDEAEFICDSGHAGIIVNLGGIPESRTWDEVVELWHVLAFIL